MNENNSSDNLCCGDDVLSRRFSALAHPARIAILRHLSGVEACCCKDVVGRLHLAQSTVSQHLKVLLEAGLVRVSHVRQSSHYMVDREALRETGLAANEMLDACAAGTGDRKMTTS
ncbi:ArsR/SmtB family transcription factor [Nitratireductor luteus]|uniref:ArsR/SmtB family transcription factor n=1 Tax=Nitratireductor luteus TaxID=2976980 RepID=UPI002240AF30|nr:metalloregulator ArsR/SmtB family transcription factor [Nitratireductor luteus]